MKSPRARYLRRVREETSYGTLRFIVDAAMVLAIAVLVLAAAFTAQNSSGTTLYLGISACLVKVILAYGGRELVRMFIDIADMFIDRNSKVDKPPALSEPQPEQR